MGMIKSALLGTTMLWASQAMAEPYHDFQPLYPPRQSAPPAMVPVTPVISAPASAPVAYQSAASHQHASRAYAVNAKPWYVGVKGDITFLEDAEFTSGVATATNEFDVGYGVSGIAGYRIMPNLRAEIEVGYRENDIDTTSITSGGTTTSSSSSGVFEAATLMANAYVDIPIASAPNFVPYVGAGAGYMFQLNGAEDSAFAYQAMAGLSYSLDGKTVLGAGYKFQQAPGVIESANGDFDATSHSVEFTLRQHF